MSYITSNYTKNKSPRSRSRPFSSAGKGTIGSGNINPVNICNYKRWNPIIKQISSESFTYETLAQMYDYDVLRKVFEWSTNYRAGVIIVYKPPCTVDHNVPYVPLETLMVQQKATEYIHNGKLKYLPVRLGFPKGQYIATDKNALATAFRELYEETGIDVFDPRLKARIAVSPIIIPRTEPSIQEVLIYFIVTIEEKVQIQNYDETELVGYQWIDILSGLQWITPTTGPTAMILKTLESINLWAPMKSISI